MVNIFEDHHRNNFLFRFFFIYAAHLISALHARICTEVVFHWKSKPQAPGRQYSCTFMLIPDGCSAVSLHRYKWYSGNGCNCICGDIVPMEFPSWLNDKRSEIHQRECKDLFSRISDVQRYITGDGSQMSSQLPVLLGILMKCNLNEQHLLNFSDSVSKFLKKKRDFQRSKLCKC